MKLPRLRLSFLAAMALAACLSPNLAAAVEPKTLRFAFQGELKAVDPYAINESFSLSVGTAVYEGLIRRRPDMTIEPCLATSWETLDPLHWRFHLRKGVKFHEGQDFTADDVVFSAASRAHAGLRPQEPRAADAKVVKVDDYTVDFILKKPEPAADQRVGELGHLLEEMGGGARRHRGDRDERDHPALCGAPRQRHGPLHPRQP